MSTEIVGGPTTADVSVASTGVIVEEDDDGQGWILDAYRSLEPGVSGDVTSERRVPATILFFSLFPHSEIGTLTNSSSPSTSRPTSSSP